MLISKILFLSALLTVLSLVIRSDPPSISFARQVHNTIITRWKLDPKVSNQLWEILSYLPRAVFPLVLVARIPLLLLAVRQQLFLHPPTPYLTANGTLRLLHSERGMTGQIVIADNLVAGYRFMRCDASILGGRWIRDIPDGKGGMIVDMGDSIFGTFGLQEVGLLAERNDESDTLARTLSLTTRLQITPDDRMAVESEIPDRSLIMYVSALLTKNNC